MRKETIALDIDEVVFPFVAEFAPWHNDNFGTGLNVEDFHSYEFENVIDGLSVPDVVDRVHMFLGLAHGHKHVSPIEKAVYSAHRLAENYDLHAVTARHPSFRAMTSEYLEEYFGDIIQEITLVGHAANMNVLKTKSSVCKEIGAIALVDDSISHLEICAKNGVGAVLFGDYPWNRGIEIPEGVIRCNNWEDTVDYFESRL